MKNSCFVFNLEGTISGRELLPAIAKTIDLKKEIEILTDLTGKGLIPFKESFRLTFAVLNTAPIAEIKNAVSDIELDKSILSFINSRPENCFVITTNLTSWIEPIASKLNCPVESLISIQNGNDYEKVPVPVVCKRNPVLDLRSKFDRIVAIGYSFDDIPIFDAADIGIVSDGQRSPP